MKRILLISLGLLAFAFFSKGQTWDFVNSNLSTRTVDEQGNQYIVTGGPRNPPVNVKHDSVIRHSHCCNDTLNTSYNYGDRPLTYLSKLNAAGKLMWETKDPFSVYISQIKVINKEIFILARPLIGESFYKDYYLGGQIFTFTDSFLLAWPDLNILIHLSESGEFIEQTLLFSSYANSTHFDLVEDDYIFYLHGSAKLMDGTIIGGEYQTKVFRMTRQGEVQWVIEKPRYNRFDRSKFTKTKEAVYFFTKDTISSSRSVPRFYKADFNGNLLDSTNIISSKIGFNYFVNMESDSEGNVYALGYIVEPIIIDEVSISTAPFVKKPILLKLDKNLNYVWHRVLCDSNLNEIYLLTISPNDAIWCHIGIEEQGSATNGINLSGRYQWIKYNTNGDLIEVLARPKTSPVETYDDFYAKYDMIYETLTGDLYLLGNLLPTFDLNPQIHFDDITITTTPRKQTFFTAKRNRKLLKLSKANIACRSDSLELAFDPVYKKFEWYFTDSSCTIPQYEGKKIRPNNLPTGKYPVLVRAYVNDSLYWCLKDTIHIIEKPVADFTTPETVVCAFQPIVFTDESTSDTVNATREEKWVWTFGDGETETVIRPFDSAQGDLTPIRMTHTYTRPGTYTVSLFYSNGFCDSTLTKNQYITVVDAPAPGFSTDNYRGCSPYTVNISDTITKNTTKKEYNFSDGRGWVEVPVNQESFDVTYVDAGTFWITQRLYGYTGCVTQQDSARIYVTPGFTDSDTSHINNATYQDVPAHPAVSEIITVSWPCLLEDSSVRYHLYRNNQKIAELGAKPCIYGQIAYQDSLEQVSKSLLTYNVLAIDSCGTATQVGRVGKPVRVSGEVIGNNELSVISYTAYQDWNIGKSELNYELQTEDIIGGWKTINDQTGTAQYRDKQFLDMTKDGIQIEKCYRVVASVGTSKASISNILCLPYSPVIFIPTAFSPNADNLNDVYRPVTFGIEQYQMKIYNRYGQQIADLDQTSAGWDAADTPQGAYMVIIRAKGTDNEWYNLKSTVTVVR